MMENNDLMDKDNEDSEQSLPNNNAEIDKLTL